MRKEDIERIRRSHAAIDDPHAFAMRFYEILFRVQPDLRRLFPAQIDAQAAKFAGMLVAVVAQLDAPSVLEAGVAELGRRHVDYGVGEADYDAVGAALLMALHEAIGEAFTPEVEQAWAAVYGEMAETMIAAGSHAVVG